MSVSGEGAPAAAMTPAASRWSGLEETPVQVAGVINAYSAMLAERAGFRALYLSGSGVPTASERAVRELERAGAAAVQLEDQVAEKRCGHRPNKRLAAADEMAERIAAAVSAR